MRHSGQALLVLAFLGASAAGFEPRARFAAPELPPREPRSMSVRLFRTLPGLGERLARAVVEERERRGSAPFRWEDVPGLGPVRSAGLRARMVALGFPPEPFEHGEARYPAETVVSRSTALALLAALAGCRPVPAVGAPEPVAAAALPEAPRHEVFRLTGAEVHAAVLGAGKEGVLFLHGARYASADWLALGVLPEVARRGLVALALDWPGSGASPAVAPAPEPGALLAELLTAAGLERVVLVAPSRGGAQAFELLARGEPRVAGLLALAPAGCERFDPGPGPHAPIRLVWGAGDEVVPVAAGEALAGRLAGVELLRVPEEGHAWYLGAPGPFLAVLGAFLDELGWPAR